MATDRTSVAVSKDTHHRLGRIGFKNQSFDDVIRDLLEFRDLYQDEYDRFQQERRRAD